MPTTMRAGCSPKPVSRSWRCSKPEAAFARSLGLITTCFCGVRTVKQQVSLPISTPTTYANNEGSRNTLAAAPVITHLLSSRPSLALSCFRFQRDALLRRANVNSCWIGSHQDLMGERAAATSPIDVIHSGRRRAVF